MGRLLQLKFTHDIWWNFETYELKSTEIITEDGQVSKGPNMYANINFFVCHGMCKYIIGAGLII